MPAASPKQYATTVDGVRIAYMSLDNNCLGLDHRVLGHHERQEFTVALGRPTRITHEAAWVTAIVNSPLRGCAEGDSPAAT